MHHMHAFKTAKKYIHLGKKTNELLVIILMFMRIIQQNKTLKGSIVEVTFCEVLWIFCVHKLNDRGSLQFKV